MKLKLIKRSKKKSTEVNNDALTIPIEDDRIYHDLHDNENVIKAVFEHPTNKAVVIRHIFITSLQRSGIVLYMRGAIQLETLEEHVLRPLLHLEQDEGKKIADEAEYVLEHIITTTNGEITDSMNSLIESVSSGAIAIFMDECDRAIIIDASGYSTRAITEPTIENYVRGPKEAFAESLYDNISLIRKQLKTPQLICEDLFVGERVSQKVSLLYIRGIAEPHIVDKVKQRIESINTDTVLNLDVLSQFIEERPYSLLPTILVTERPDRASAFLLEGHVILLMENSPSALVMPITFWNLFHTGEDHYMRLIDGNFIRLFRFVGLFIALFAPAVYIAISTFHSEMLPTDLMLAIAANRERVPFASIFEIIIMELSFEILREAGVRVPSVIGATIGIVGALILGQAAVDANIVSPIMVIIVAVTGLSSFTIPDVSLGYAIRTARFILLIAAAFIGFFGIGLVTAYFVIYLCSMKSFGVPFMSPLAPSLPSSKDFVFRPPVWKQSVRPSNISKRESDRGSNQKGSRQ